MKSEIGVVEVVTKLLLLVGRHEIRNWTVLAVNTYSIVLVLVCRRIHLNTTCITVQKKKEL